MKDRIPKQESDRNNQAVFASNAKMLLTIPTQTSSSVTDAVG
jgi:hypothetical protein